MADPAALTRAHAGRVFHRRCLPMKALSLSIALTLCSLATPVAAGDGVSMCDVHSDYSLHVADDGIRFTRESGSPGELRFAGGRLYADGVEQALDDDGRHRVLQFEHSVQALVPEVKALALDAVALATEAVGQVAVALAGERNPALEQRLQALQVEITAGIEQAISDGHWDERLFEQDVERLVSEVVPMLAGDIVSAAVAAAMSGDESQVQAIEKRAQEFERTFEREVEARAGLIEERAEALCPRIAELHALQQGLRLADGRALGLMRM